MLRHIQSCSDGLRHRVSWPAACALIPAMLVAAGCATELDDEAVDPAAVIPVVAEPAAEPGAMVLSEDHEHPTVRELAPPVTPQGEEELYEQQPCPPDEQCMGVPSTPPILYNAVGTGKRPRGANSQLAIPQNLLLADIDADGYSDFLQYTSNKIFVSKTNFQKTGVLHLYTARPIKRVITGDFHGDGYDQTCVIQDDNALVCFGISTNRRELWWWFTQGSFIGDSEASIVGDFDGDGRDDILVYPQGGGAYRMYSIKGDFFFGATPSFAQGNLSGVTGAGMQVRAGDFNADGRDDVMVVNSWRQILYYVSVFDGTNHTFWWAFTTVSYFVGADDHVTVARIDDNGADDIVLHNRVNGATRFHRMEYNGGSPPAITNVSNGQISTISNSLLFWGYMHGPLSEPGAYWRDDAMVYDLYWNMFVRSDARWDGSVLTYWWNYTQWAPNNHTGWAAFTAKPWLFLKCKFSDIATTPRTDQFYRDLMFSYMGQVGYWRDISYGSWDLSSSRVIDTWYTMSITNADWRNLPSRWDRAGKCISAYGGSTAGYVNVISLVNGEGDAGNHGGRVLMTPDSTNTTFLSHEVAHTFGWGHSFDDTTRKNSDWSAPGEYFDYWDIMSAMAVYAFANSIAVTAGPEMNAPYKTKQAFIPVHRITRFIPGSTPQSRRLNIAAINRPEADGPLMVRIGADDNNYYTVEYRMVSGWDAGIPRAAVLVHRVTNGTSYLITANGGPERLVGSVSSYTLGSTTITVRVHGFATEGYTADVTVEY